MSSPSFSGLVAPFGGGLGTDFEAPSGRGFIALLEAFRATGGTATGEIVRGLLEAHQIGNAVGKAVSLDQLISTGRVFGFEWRDKLWIPMFQFHTTDLSLKDSAQQVRSALPPLWSGWGTASWFAAPNAQLQGCRPVDMLDSDIDAVMLTALSMSAPDSLAHARPPHQAASLA